jgi:hypothetical protein
MAQDQYKIAQFEPRLAKKDAVWLIIGPRNSGKTFLTSDILYNTRHLYDMGFAICGTEGAAENCRKFLPSRLVHTGYDAKVVDQFLEVCTELRGKGKERHVVLIEDDLFSNPSYIKSPTQVALHVNGRQIFTSKITCCQYAMFIPAGIRGNIDFVLAMRDTNIANRKRLYDYFFGSFPNFKEFNRVFEQCTKDYKCLVIDKTKVSGNIADSIKWYKSAEHTPPFRLGKPIFFYLSKHIDEENRKQIAKERFSGMKSIVI